MKVVALIGDSHTWGEGVGAERCFDPPVCCGDLRPLPFSPPCYANLLRDGLNAATASFCSEYEWQGGRAVTPGEPLTVLGGFSLARVFFIAEAEGAEGTLTAPGALTVTVNLQSDRDTYNTRVQVAHLLIPRGEAEGLTVTLTAGKRLLVYRVELYGGEYALVNCGIGSCPVGKFTDTYFARYVEPLSPFALVFEGCTINDWLQTPSPALYAANLERMLEAQRGLTPRILWHTVTPIAGSQISGQGTVYADYVEAMRSVASAGDVPMVDCNASMEAILAAIPEESRAPYFYHDPWHPNGEGHRLYAEAIFPLLTELLGE